MIRHHVAVWITGLPHWLGLPPLTARRIVHLAAIGAACCFVAPAWYTALAMTSGPAGNVHSAHHHALVLTLLGLLAVAPLPGLLRPRPVRPRTVPVSTVRPGVPRAGGPHAAPSRGRRGVPQLPARSAVAPPLHGPGRVYRIGRAPVPGGVR